MKKVVLAFAMVFWILAHPLYSQSSKKKSSGKDLGSSAQKNFGVGLKLGDPLGLTLKKYMGPKWGLEFVVGRTFYWGGGYDNYYDDKPPHNPPPGGGPYHDNYYDPRGVSFQLHLLYHMDIPPVKGLQLYFGGGPQLRVLSYHYRYWYNGASYYDDSYHQVGFGLDGVFGSEYTFADVPITVFADLGLYMEVAGNPFWAAVQGGVGARFNF
jgi:hypothetical protein